MEAAFAGAEDVVDGGSILLCVLDALVKGVVFLRGALAPSEVAMVVGAGQKAHACIFGVSIVDGEPAGDGFTGGERPIAGVLMPRHAFAVPGHFAKKMGSPTDNLRPKQILHTGNDARVGEKIINAAIFQMSGANGVAIAAVGEGLLEESVEVGTVPGDFDFFKNGERADIAGFVEVVDLFAGERGGVGARAGVKAQVALDAGEVGLVRGGFEIGDGGSLNFQGSSFKIIGH